MLVFKVLTSFILICLFRSTSSAEELYPEEVTNIIKSAQALCKGKFKTGEAIQRIDLNQDDVLDYIVDESRFRCSKQPGLYLGTQGAVLHIILQKEDKAQVVFVEPVVEYSIDSSDKEAPPAVEVVLRAIHPEDPLTKRIQWKRKPTE